MKAMEYLANTTSENSVNRRTLIQMYLLDHDDDQ